MPTETGRHRLYETIKQAWGEDNAAELMSYLPPVGWSDVATKGDLDTHRAATRQDLVLLGAELRGEVAQLGAELREDLAKLEARIERGFSKQSRSIVYAMVGLTAIFSMVVGLFSFLG
jgi:hypothetical protein